MRATRAIATLVAVGSVLLTAACTDSDPEPAPSPAPEATTEPTSTPTEDPDYLTFGVYGPQDVLDAYQRTVDTWNSDPDRVEVRLKTWDDREAMRTAIEARGAAPDVFLTSRSDLAWILEEGFTQPVDELLDERGVNFGDGYSRDGLQAFSADNRLQCMPYGISPMVIYYNTALIDFERMRERGLDVPGATGSSWSFEQFAAAAQFATRPKRGTKGVHIDPSLTGLGPFIASGGGSVFDDDVAPTSLALSDDASRDALERTLELLRNPQVTLDDSRLRKASALRWFERGKLGMIAGYRTLVPRLRQVEGLEFDVMPMPRLDGAATVGAVTGLCLSAKAASTPLAADFMVHEISAESVGVLARTGYLQPANVQVALSEDFLQTGQMPERATIFNTSLRSLQFAPLIDTLPRVEEEVRPILEQMVYGAGVLDLEALTEQADAASRAVLDPESVSKSPDPEDADTEDTDPDDSEESADPAE